MDAARREIKEELNVSLPENARITTDEVVVVQQFGLLMRYHIVHCRFATRPKLVPNREIIATKWAKSSDLLVAPEVIHAERTL
jgi:ADP-ribose pyrophosphatase YjhB (NUDIX family)